MQFPLDESLTRPTRLPQLIRLGLQSLPLSFRLLERPLITTHRFLLHSLSPTHLPCRNEAWRGPLESVPWGLTPRSLRASWRQWLIWLVFNVPIVWIFDPWTWSPASVESSGPLLRAKIIGVGSSSPAEPSVECPAKTVYGTCPRRAFDVNISDVPCSFPFSFRRNN